MGVNTDYLGHIEIVPGLNQTEYDYLRAFAASRRCNRPDGPYAVTPTDPDHRDRDQDIESYNEIAEGQPSLWCQWEPCAHGCCIGWNGHEKFYAGPAWLQYLIDHFLRPGALAQKSGDPQFESFTFDHRMNGFVVGERKDIRELFALIVADDEVHRVVLRDGDPGYGEPGYQGPESRPWLARDYEPWRSSLDEFGISLEALPNPAGQRSTRRRPAAKKSARLRSVTE